MFSELKLISQMLKLFKCWQPSSGNDRLGATRAPAKISRGDRLRSKYESDIP